MTTLSLKDAGFLARDPLFQNITQTFGDGDRVGLIALNGGGKTTFLRCLTGERELTSGEVTLSRGARIGYMPQDIDEPLLAETCRNAVLSALPEAARADEAWRADMVLATLDFPENLMEEPVSSLSGGWQRLLLLARAWVSEPDILLMDEPTNHLDLEKILFLEDWIQTWAANMPVVIASHDRSFLDSVTNRTLFLRPEVSPYFSLGYSRAREELVQLDEAAATQRERELNEANRLRRQSAKLKNIGINSGSDLLQKKQKQLRERAERIEARVDDLHQERPGEIRLSDGGTHAKTLVRIKDLLVETPDHRKLFVVKAMSIAQGDRVALLGHNGTGKSTLVRLLRDVLVEKKERAEVKVTPTLLTGYVDQALSDVPMSATSFAFVSGRGESDARCRSSLASAGIPFDWQDKPMDQLSWGQRSRVALLALRFQEPNFYLLDEPTNHVDIAGQEALAAEVRERGAGCLLVSHDRTFVREVATRYLVIRNGELKEVDSPDEYFGPLAP